MPRLRFRLRSLLFLITAFAICLGVYISSLRERERAVEAILKLGGTVQYDYEFDEAGNLLPDAKPPGPQWLRRLFGPQWRVSVVGVNLWTESGGKATDQDLSVLASLPMVRSLMFDANTAITDEGLKYVSRLEHLEWLDLNSCTGITDQGLAHLSNLRRLSYLCLANCQIDGSGLQHVQHLPLTMLNLNWTELQDPNLKYVSSMQSLNFLSMQDTPLTNAGLKHVRGLVNLVSLHAHNTRITDEGLAHLYDLQNLYELHVHGDGVTENGIESLKRELSTCKMIE